MPSPHAFLFDLDGTLLDSRRAVIDAVAAGLRRAYDRCGLPAADPDRALIADCMGLPTDQYFRRAFPEATVPPALRDAFARAFAAATAEEEVAALARGETSLYPGVEEALAELKRRGHPLLLFSNAGAAYFRAVVDAHRLDRFFAASLCLEEAWERDPAADKTAMVLGLATDPARTVVVGDREGDVAAGRAAGARTVGCLYGFGDREELRAADWLVDGPLAWLDLPLTEPAL